MPCPYRVPVGNVFIECEGPDEVMSLVHKLTNGTKENGAPEDGPYNIPARVAMDWLAWAKHIIYANDLCEESVLEKITDREARDIIEVFLDKLMGHREAKDDEHE